MRRMASPAGGKAGKEDLDAVLSELDSEYGLRHDRGKLYDGKATPSQSVLNLINCILGAGVLGYPYCFKSCGVVLATIIMVLSLMACRFSYQLLLQCSQLTGLKSYEEMAERAVGKVGRQVVELCTAALNLGCVVAYINILADVLSAVAGTIIPPGAEPSRNVYITGVTILGVLPVSLVVRDHSIVAAFSAASVAFVILFAVVIVIFAVAPSTTAGAVRLWHQDGLLVAFPVMAYSFTAHPYYLSIYSTLQSPSIPRMIRVTDVAMGAVATLYWLVGVGGYMCFRQRTSGDLLRNFGSSAPGEGVRGAYEHALKLCYGLSILGSVPLVIMPFQSILLPALDIPMQRHKSWRSIAGSFSDLRGTLAGIRGSFSDLRALSRGPHSDLKAAKGSFTDLQSYGAVPLDPPSAYPSAPQPMPGRYSSNHLVPAPPGQHALVCFLIIGVAMASALWVPNVEFIFGLTGATASVTIAYILPAITYMRLHPQAPAAPRLSEDGLARHHSHGDSRKLARRRRWQATGLLVFGIITAVACTNAILGAVKEEAAVVQLAQELVAKEVVVAEAHLAEQKAQRAATAVTAVTTAAKDLGSAHSNASSTLGNLQQAAAELNTIATPVHNVTKPAVHVWDLRGRMQEHQAAAAEAKVLGSVEAQLAAARSQLVTTRDAVLAVIARLDLSLTQMDSASPAMSPGAAYSPGSKQEEKAPADRVGDLAKELASALGVHAKAQQAVSSGSAKSLEQVRAAATSAATNFNRTILVIDRSLDAVATARLAGHQSHLKEAVVEALEGALNATASSAAAVETMTGLLQGAATSEMADLLAVLTQVAKDMEAASSHSKKSTLKVSPLAADSTPSTTSTATTTTTATATTEAVSTQQQGAASTQEGGGAAMATSSSGNATTTVDGTTTTPPPPPPAPTGTSSTTATSQADPTQDPTQSPSTTTSPSTTSSPSDANQATLSPLPTAPYLPNRELPDTAAKVVAPEGTTKPAEQAEQALGKVKEVISDLSKVVEVMKTNATAGSAAAGGGSNLTAAEVAVATAVMATQQGVQAAVDDMTTAINKTQARVADRVANILHDLGTIEQQNKGGALAVEEKEAEEEAAKKEDGGVTGPVVLEDASGKLQQQEGAAKAEGGAGDSNQHAGEGHEDPGGGSASATVGTGDQEYVGGGQGSDVRQQLAGGAEDGVSGSSRSGLGDGVHDVVPAQLGSFTSSGGFQEASPADGGAVKIRKFGLHDGAR